jgi:hypothetical protein
MAKPNTKSNASDPVVVTGFEQMVDRLRTMSEEFKAIKDVIDTDKQTLRSSAEQAFSQLPQDFAGNSVGFQGSDGRLIVVSRPDYTREGNRLGVTDDVLDEASAHGIALEHHLETETCFVLRGEWVSWFEQFLATNEGINLDGIEKKVTRKLNKSGVSYLYTLARGGGMLGQVANALFQRCVRAFAVKV